MRLLSADRFIEHYSVTLKDKIKELKKVPKLVIIKVGNDPASEVYVRNKVKVCNEFGIEVKVEEMSERSKYKDLMLAIHQYNIDPNVTSILLQLPLPQHLRVLTDTLKDNIYSPKDVDCLGIHNLGNIIRKSNIYPCTPYGIEQWLKFEGVELEGKNVVIINRSELVGKPLALMLINNNANVTVCHSRTKDEDLKRYVENADIIVTAVGKAGFINKEFNIKDGAFIVDVGINRDEFGKLCGDVKISDFLHRDITVTKVPGGVGKVTTLMVVNNVIQNALTQGY